MSNLLSKTALLLCCQAAIAQAPAFATQADLASGESPPAEVAIAYANAYRALMGLPTGEVDPMVETAARSHVQYMARHGMLSHVEQRGAGGFTGESVKARVKAAGFSVKSASYFEVVSMGNSWIQAIDEWMNSVYHRLPFTVPVWTAVGFGEQGDFAEMTMVTPYPMAGPALLYPVDGQEYLPSVFDSDSEWPDPAPGRGLVGTPITLTRFGAELELVSARLDPDVPLIVVEPNDLLRGMVAVLPEVPLAPGGTYTATLEVRVDGRLERHTSTFTTAGP